MKQETGNNLSAPKNDVSIQLKLGGHSFSTAALASVPADADITFIVETHKVTLVPKKAFDESLAADYMSAVGLSCATDETTVCSDVQAKTIAVMVINKTAHSEIIGKFGSRAKFTSPLLCSDHDSGSRNISIRITDGIAYFRAFDNGLQVAEAVKTASDNDVLYYAVRIGEALNFGKDTDIYIKGGKSAAKLVKRYFKKVICE